jgi:hypothetical protein
MSPLERLALVISDLYGQIMALRQQLEAAHARIAELEPTEGPNDL